MSKIISEKTANVKTLKLWDEIEQKVKAGEFERYRVKDDYVMVGIKFSVIGEEHYISDCPLCEYYAGDLKCPLSVGDKSCETGCFDYGFSNFMTLEDIVKFNLKLKEKVVVE